MNRTNDLASPVLKTFPVNPDVVSSPPTLCLCLSLLPHLSGLCHEAPCRKTSGPGRAPSRPSLASRHPPLTLLGIISRTPTGSAPLAMPPESKDSTRWNPISNRAGRRLASFYQLGRPRCTAGKRLAGFPKRGRATAGARIRLPPPNPEVKQGLREPHDKPLGHGDAPRATRGGAPPRHFRPSETWRPRGPPRIGR